MTETCGVVRVLHVTAVPETVTSFLVPLLDALRTSGYQVDIACRNDAGAERLRKSGYAVNPIAFSRRVVSISHLRTLRELRRLLKRGHYDLVHVHTPLASVLGRLAAWTCRVPIVVYTAHGFYFHDRMSPYLRRGLIWIERFLARRTTDFLLTVSCEDRDTAIRERIMPTTRIHCLRSVGLNLSRFDACQEHSSIRASLGLLPGDRVVCFVGRLVREKGILDLAEAMAAVRTQVPNAKLLVVGEALPSDRVRGTAGRLARLIEKHALEGSVVFAGYREDVPALLSLSDVFVLPSYREGMPVTILEAMASRKPVVATDIRGCREEVVDGVTGRLVPPGDPRALADAVSAILMDSEGAAKMGQAGRKRVEAEFDEKRVVAEQLALYKQLLTGRK